MERKKLPSEDTPEQRLLDAVNALTERLDAVPSRPPFMQSSWWDQLPQEFGELLGKMNYHPPPHHMQIDGSRNILVARYQFMPDRMEISLVLNGGWVVWQRALFYGKPPA